MNDTTIQVMSVSELLNGETVYSVQGEAPETRERLKALMFARLAELNASSETVQQMKKMFAELDKADKLLAAQYTREYARENARIPLQFDGRGRPLVTIENFLMILRNDEQFRNIKFNELSYKYEQLVNGEYVEWKNVDDSRARAYIESTYCLHHEKKLDDAMRIVFDEHRYHPVKELIESIKWDGKPRLRNLFIKWLKCEDSDYTREVTRLVFAGGIHRVYNPGCKFDDVCVLVGTKQGEGKSTFVQWLAMEDRFFTVVKNIEKKDDLEALQGKWICELSELMAVTRAQDVESVKSFITTQIDRYRMSYDKRTEDYPRQCVFVGTTNKQQFLTDKTGNRRWYPLKVHSVGYDLYDHKAEIQEEIAQCWAEAKAMYDKGELLPFASRDVLEQIKENQTDAVEDDYRVGLIKKYLHDRERVCILELWQNALGYEYAKPSRKDSNDIVLIMQNIEGWERMQKSERSEKYGVQRFWRNLNYFVSLDNGDPDEIPF